MSSDADYGSFLDQANQDVSGGGSASTTSKKAQLKTVDSAVPTKLKSLDAFYTSEADEPFEPVSLKWDGGTLDESKAPLSPPAAPSYKPQSFAKLVGHGGTAEELSAKSFDPRGQYNNVVDAVKEEVGGAPKFFRVETAKTKAEYFIVGVKEGKVLGVKASAVET